MDMAKLQLVIEGSDKGALAVIKAQIKAQEQLEVSMQKIASNAQTQQAKVAAAESYKQREMLRTSAVAAKAAQEAIATAAKTAAAVEESELRKKAAMARTEAAMARNAVVQARSAMQMEKLQGGGGGGAGGGGGGVFAGFGGKLTDLAQSIFYIKGAFDAVVGSITQFTDAAEQGARVADMRKYFEATGKSIEEYRQATRGMISDQELMAKSNLADTMGITGDQFKMLARIAQISSAKTGQSFDHMFQSIIVGSARSSRLLLDNLGIIVSVEEANKRYAQSLLTGADAAKYKDMTEAQLIKTMSDREKQTAFIMEVQRKATDLEKQAGDAAATSAEKYAQFTAAVENLKTALKEGLAGAFGDVVVSITEMLTELKKLELSPIIAYALAAGGAGFVGAGPLGALFGAGVGAAMGLNRSMQTQDTAEAEMQALREQQTAMLRQVQDIQRANNIPLVSPVAMLQESADSLALMARWSPGLAKSWQEFIELNKKTKMFTAAAAPPAAKPGEDPAGRAKILKEEAAKKAKQMADESDAFWRKQADAHAEAMKKLDETVAKNQEAFAKDIADLDSRIRDEALKDMERAAKEGADKFAADIQRIDDAIAALDEADRAFKDWLDSLANALLSAINGSPFQALLGTKMFGAAGDQTLLGSAGSAIGGAIGSGFGPVGGMIGDLLGSILGPALDQLKPVMAIINRTQQGLAKMLELGFGPLFNAMLPLGDAMYQFLAALGPVIGAILNAFIPLVKMTVALSVFISQIQSAVAIALSPFIEIIASLNAAGIGFIANLVYMIPQVMNVTTALSYFGEQLILTAVRINNAIVEWIRTATPFKDFGQMLNESDFVKAQNEAANANTEAANANTEAMRDLTREFRNLPSGYKVEGATYAATAPVRQRRYTGDFNSVANQIVNDAFSWNDLRRWRT